ncbi:SunT ABC-type bacteriocin/lantibiotic exporters, contain an N-terminal double-glycine peptidase domain [Candidatus Nanopelagicaceae bacterium]
MSPSNPFKPLATRTKIAPQVVGVYNDIKSILTKRDQIRILIVTVIQIGLSLLDLISVAFIGLLTALTINGIQSKQPVGTVSEVLSFLGIGGLSFQQQAAFLGLMSGILLVIRTILALWFSKKLLLFLSLRGAEFSSKMIRELLKQPLLVVQEKSVQETIFRVTVGVGAITNGVIAIAVSLVADCALLAVMLIGLSFVNMTISILTALAFCIVGILLFHLLKHRAAVLAANDAGWTVKSNQKIAEVLVSYREATVRNRKDYYTELISDYRFKMARAQAEAMFIPTISKYVIEMSLVIGSLLLAATQFLLFDAVHAISILSIFLAAGSRIAPAILRLQQGAIQIRSNIAVAASTLELWKKIQPNSSVSEGLSEDDHQEDLFDASVEIRNVSFIYPNATVPTLENMNLTVKSGEMLAIVGASGAGKTTLVDLILGVLTPSQGTVSISGIDPEKAIKAFKGKISYVPQDVLIVDGSVRENVALGYPNSEISDEDVWDALNAAQLDNFVKTLPMQLNHQIGERGANLSGGQRQRLGLARGLYTKPKLLVLDEATSALDGDTEANITQMLHSLRGEITLFVIAHRLSTIKDAERIIYLEQGQIIAEGDFSQIQIQVPNFAPEILANPKNIK